MPDSTDPKGIGSKFGGSRRGTAPSAVPAAPAAPTSPSDPTAVLPTAAPATPAPAAPSGPTPPAHSRHARRPVRRGHVAATPAAAPAPADDAPESSEDTEQVHLTREEAIAAAKKEIQEDADKEKEHKKLKNRAKRAPKAFLTWLGKWCKKHWFITAILVVALIASLTMWVNGKFGGDNAGVSEPQLIAPKAKMPGGDEGSQRGSRAENAAPTVKDDGDALTFGYTDPNFSGVTFDVITDNDLNIREVKLGDKLKEYGGKLSIGTVDGSQESDARCSSNAQNCDFSSEKISICGAWLSLSRIIPIQGGNNDQQQPFWTAIEVFNATPSDNYPGEGTDLPQHCGVKDTNPSS